MTRKITRDGESLLTALREVVAQLASCDTDQVEVKIDAPNLDASATGAVTLRLEGAELVPPPAEPPADAEPTPDTASEEDHESAEDEESESDEESSNESDAAAAAPTPEELDEEAEAAADFLEGLLDIMDLPGDLKLRIHDDHAEVEVVDAGSGTLIGRRGQTLEAVQELVRTALQREFERRCRVKIDVEGYRVRRLEKLHEKAVEVIESVQRTGEPERLEPMDVFERKAIHRLVAEHEGVTSRSQGREPGRRIVIEPE